MAKWFTGNISINNNNIHYYRTGGEKPALVLVHGVTDNGLSWSRVARELEQDYDVIMYDQRGHGFSGAPRAGYSFEDHAEDLAGLIAALNLRRPQIIGHSGGAAAAALLAARHPALPASLVLEDPPWGTGWGDWAAMTAGIRHWFLKIVSMTADELGAYCRESNPTWLEEEWAVWVASKLQVNPNVVQGFDQPAPSWRETVRKITCPILLITGDQDKGAVNTPGDVQEFTATWHRGQAAYIDGAGHMVHYDRFEPFIATVKAFLVEADGKVFRDAQSGVCG